MYGDGNVNHKNKKEIGRTALYTGILFAALVALASIATSQ